MMAAVRFSFLKSGFSDGSQTCTSNFTKLTNRIPNQSYPNSVSRRLDVDYHFRVAPLQSLVDNRHYRVEPVSAFSHRCLQNNGFLNLSSWKSSFPLGASSFYRAYSSFFGGKGDGQVSAGSVADGSNVVGTDWVDNLKTGLQSVVDASVYTGGKAKEAANELTPHIHQLLESHSYLKDVIIPVSGTLTGTLFAWVVLPRVLRKFHKYSVQNSAALSSGNLPQEQIPYEKSIWGAVEDPVRYLASFTALSYLGVLIAPTTITIQYMPGVCRGAAVGALMWFLFRLKNNLLSRPLAVQSIAGLDRESWLAIDKFLSVGLIGLGLMSFAEACGVAVQSIVTVGGIGGVATAFAARDILGNMLSGLSMQFTKPFSLGDTIKAGSIEGQVIEMGLTTTSLLNAEKFPVLVPNSLFSSQVIVNKSRAQWRAMLTKVPLRIDNFENIPQISEDIKSMLSSNTNIFLEKEAPYCFLSRIENSFAELTIGCNLKHMTKDELYSTQQDILLQAAKIIKQHGAALGSTSQDLAYQ